MNTQKPNLKTDLLQKLSIDTSEERKPYVPPRVIHEIELEVRAGSPVPEFDDLLDLGKPGP
jgi:hypothetical protein